MACLLAVPTQDRKGVISITTPEWRKYLQDKSSSAFLDQIKQKYIIGLHHNWHPVKSPLDERFDFHFLCLDQLQAPLPKNTTLIEMDACNFVPSAFMPSNENPTWDLLIIGRTVRFKRPSKALDVVRQLFDQGHDLKVLFIAPIPKFRFRDIRYVDYRIRTKYKKMFNSQEREKFTLIASKDNHPFPFSRDELAVFYRNSRAFVHFATDETRCRVASYAWACGIPVIGRDVIGDVLPDELRKEPAFYKVENDDYAISILGALGSDKLSSEYVEKLGVASSTSIPTLVRELNGLERIAGLITEDDIFGRNLDIRLGYHHLGNVGNNAAGQDFFEFIKSILDSNSFESLWGLRQSAFPEREIAAG